MKKNAFGLAGVSALVCMTLVGCGTDQQTQGEPMTVAQPVVTELPLVCDDYSLKNRLMDAVKASLLDATLQKVSNGSPRQLEDLENRVREKLSQVNININNVTNLDDGCSADVHMVFGGQSSQERIIMQGVRYHIVDQRAVLDQPDGLFNGVAQLVIDQANAVVFVPTTSQMQMVEDTPQESLPAARLQVVDRQPVAQVQGQDQALETKPPKQAQPTPKAEARSNAKPGEKREQETKTVSSKETTSENKKPESKLEPKKSQANSDKVSEKQTQKQAPAAEKPSANPSPAPKPKQTAKPEPAVDEADGRISIVEINETY